MSLRTEATVEDLYRVPENGKAELVNGEIVLMSPTGGFPSIAGGEIFASLRDYARQTKIGRPFTDGAGFIVDLPNRKSFSPDASYHIGRVTMKFVVGAPVFAAEVRSEGDYGQAAEREMAEKRADYFAAGTKVVWDVDLRGKDVVRSYRFDRPETPMIFRRGEVADAEPAVPGWTMPVNDLFPPSE